jgi:hypothetical protein
MDHQRVILGAHKGVTWHGGNVPKTMGGSKNPRLVVCNGEGPSPHMKGLATLTLLTVWEIWKEWNARVFPQNVSPSSVILDKIKCEARLWIIAGAK